MHYTVVYVGKPEEKQKAALDDTRDFLGSERFDQLTNLFCESEQPLENLVVMIGFTGVSGFAARAWAEHVEHLRSKTIQHVN